MNSNFCPPPLLGMLLFLESLPYLFRPSQNRRLLCKKQRLFFSIESMLDIHPLENFNILFSNLKADHLDSARVTERKPFSH